MIKEYEKYLKIGRMSIGRKYAELLTTKGLEILQNEVQK